MEFNLGETKESYKIRKIKILEKLCNSIIQETDNEKFETNDIEKLSYDVKDPDEAAKLVNRMDKMISNKKNNILTMALKQGKIFKRFKANNFRIIKEVCEENAC